MVSTSRHVCRIQKALECYVRIVISRKQQWKSDTRVLPFGKVFPDVHVEVFYLAIVCEDSNKANLKTEMTGCKRISVPQTVTHQWDQLSAIRCCVSSLWGVEL
ncbi:hypothetical protein XU18_4594 [Perkinsela sp. CCAP 1560/4]|nr:hypothetical protein XU18_4594 [Perkinsela sp. CCAP 1560/4]|eukprot:KNH04098.1 hypothetical protein XU18_4594 [Perkinsela sp. CCAP 1560/4]